MVFPYKTEIFFEKNWFLRLAYFQNRYKLIGIVLEGLVHNVNNLLIIFLFVAVSGWGFVFRRVFRKKFEKTLF